MGDTWQRIWVCKEFFSCFSIASSCSPYNKKNAMFSVWMHESLQCVRGLLNLLGWWKEGCWGSVPQCSNCSKVSPIYPVSTRTSRRHSGRHRSEQNSTAVSAYTDKSGLLMSPCVCIYSCVWCEDCLELDLDTWSAQECWLQILAVPDAGTWLCTPCPAAGTDSFAQTNIHTLSVGLWFLL